MAALHTDCTLHTDTHYTLLYTASLCILHTRHDACIESNAENVPFLVEFAKIMKVRTLASVNYLLSAEDDFRIICLWSGELMGWWVDHQTITQFVGPTVVAISDG